MPDSSRLATTTGILDLMVEVAEEVIRPRWRALGAGDVSEKAPGDVVTIADRESELRITAELQAAFPNALVVGEEAVAADPSLLTGSHRAEHVFYVDPVDGTREFIKGSPDHALMIGEMRSGEITRGWIYQPEHGRAYIAEKGAGVRSSEGEVLRCRVHDADDLHGATSVSAIVTDGQLGRQVNRVGICCGIDYPDLLVGLQDFLLYARPKPWDHVPGSLMVREAGGVVRTIDGDDYHGQPTAHLLALADPERWADAERQLLASLR